ncbi:MAG: phytoene/squalene synthase family protein [Terriglobales bacterium]|jgi:phytoene synthase|nr:phytoene/squalene synthase family protein [Terriglobales bacterium]
MSTVLQQMPSYAAPSASQLAMAYSVCRGITQKRAKNFYYAFLVLPRHKRQALCAVYAFMRKCDDLTDEDRLPQTERRQKLSEWLNAFHRSLAGEPTDDPILLALTDAQHRFNIQIGWLDQLAYGTEMDVTPSGTPDADGLTVSYRTFEDLRLYCYRVASVVGLVCIRIFGYRDPAAESLAERCGLAFQLTNIIRDVKEDAAMGRVYLPQEDLARFGVSASQLVSVTDPAPFRSLLAMEAERAREYYSSGEQLFPYIDEDSRAALWVLLTIYRRLLDKIASRGFDVFHGKISLSTPEKLVILGKGFLKRLA